MISGFCQDILLRCFLIIQPELLTCLPIVGPIDSREDSPCGGARSQEEDPIQRKADGEDPVRGGPGPGGQGGQAALALGSDGLRLARAFRRVRSDQRQKLPKSTSQLSKNGTSGNNPELLIIVGPA